MPDTRHKILRKDELMRKVKVVAALLCALTPGVLGGYRFDGAYSVRVSGQRLNDVVLLAEPATAAASIETTIVTSTTKPVTTSAADTTTTAEEETTTTATENLEAEITTTETEMTGKTVSTEPVPLVAAAPQTTTKKTAAVKKVTTTETVQTTTTAKTTSETDAEGSDAPEQSETTAETKPARPITDAEYIMLCNVVGHEYGANWISEYDKALVVEVVMNRVRSPKFPNTIYGVLTQKNQFTGMKKYIDLGTFSRQVTKSVKAAVDLYFAEPERFNHGYLYFTGDGKRNYFRTRY